MHKQNVLTIGEIYHIFNKSIAGFKIFNTDSEYSRIIKSINYYQSEKQPTRFARFIESKHQNNESITTNLKINNKIVDIIAYCVMPTHIHLILHQLIDNGISSFMSNISNSYSRYFNIKHKRKGPLWEGRFKRVLVETDEQLLHLTRYIHLNPTTAFLADKPELWTASSYNEYLNKNNTDKICNFCDIVGISNNNYKKFVEDGISYQRHLAKIKNLVLE